MPRFPSRLSSGPTGVRLLAGAWLCCLFFLRAPNAAAELERVEPLPTRSDGVYGRLDGDFVWALAAGVESWSKQGRATLRASAHYFYMAGIYASYGRAWTQASNPQQHGDVGVVGFELRPGFLPRWSLDLQRGPALLDLVVDSLSLAAGAYWGQAQSENPWGSAATGANGWSRGLEASLGVGVPLLARATGPWLELRAGGRWNNGEQPTDHPWGVQVLLSWHQLWQSPLRAVR